MPLGAEEAGQAAVERFEKTWAKSGFRSVFSAQKTFKKTQKESEYFSLFLPTFFAKKMMAKNETMIP